MVLIANRGYTKYLVIKKEKGNLTFNIIFNTRFYYRVLYKRFKGNILTRNSRIKVETYF